MALRTMFQHATKLCTTSVPALAATCTRAMSTRFVNRIELLGRVGREPQKIGQNEAVAFPFYTETVLKLQDGSVKTYPCWHKVLVVRKSMANVVLSSVERGQRCYINGRIAYKAAEQGPDGKTVYSHQAAIVADNIVFLEKSRKDLSADSAPKESIESIN